jgi:hypothetical protein
MRATRLQAWFLSRLYSLHRLPVGILCAIGSVVQATEPGQEGPEPGIGCACGGGSSLNLAWRGGTRVLPHFREAASPSPLDGSSRIKPVKIEPSPAPVGRPGQGRTCSVGECPGGAPGLEHLHAPRCARTRTRCSLRRRRRHGVAGHPVP